MILRLLAICLLIVATVGVEVFRSSKCSPGYIPSALEVLPSGHLALGCTPGICFGLSTTPNSTNQARCLSAYADHCEKHEWIGAVAPPTGGLEKPLRLQCCSYYALSYSVEAGVYSLRPGQRTVLGEGEYINNIVKYHKSGGIKYHVFVRRLPCVGGLPDYDYDTQTTTASRQSVLSGIVEKTSKKPLKQVRIDSALGPVAADPNNPPPVQELQIQPQPTQQPEPEQQLEPLWPSGGDPDYEIPDVPADTNVAPSGTKKPLKQIRIEANSRPLSMPDPFNQPPEKESQLQPPPRGPPTVQEQQLWPSNGDADYEVHELPMDAKALAEVKARAHGAPIQQYGNAIQAAPSGGCSSGGYCAAPTQDACAPGCQAQSGGCSAQCTPQCSGFMCPSLYACFTADTLIRLQDGSVKRMDELHVDDSVLSVDWDILGLAYSPVTTWLHRMPEELAEFRRIALEDGTVLTVTAKHFVYQSDCWYRNQTRPFDVVDRLPVYAEEVSVGDCMLVVDESSKQLIERRVENVTLTWERGIYAPMTSNSDIIVNGVLSSCYNNVMSNVLQTTVFTFAEDWPLVRSLIGDESHDAQEVGLPRGLSLMEQLLDVIIPEGLSL